MKCCGLVNGKSDWGSKVPESCQCEATEQDCVAGVYSTVRREDALVSGNAFNYDIIIVSSIMLTSRLRCRPAALLGPHRRLHEGKPGGGAGNCLRHRRPAGQHTYTRTHTRLMSCRKWNVCPGKVQWLLAATRGQQSWLTTCHCVPFLQIFGMVMAMILYCQIGKKDAVTTAWRPPATPTPGHAPTPGHSWQWCMAQHVFFFFWQESWESVQMFCVQLLLFFSSPSLEKQPNFRRFF